MLRWFLAVALTAAGAVFAVQWVHEGRLDDRLLREDADRVPRDPFLSAHAIRLASPVYTAQCASCHGADFRGDRQLGVPDLATGQFLYGSGEVSELERTIAYGIRSGRPRSWNLAYMPAFAAPNPYSRYQIDPLTPREIDDVIDYLYSRGGRPANAEAAARGRDIYQKRGDCFDCHGAAANGDSAVGAPSLVGDHWLYGDGSRAALFQSIAHGHHGICPGWRGEPDPLKTRALAVYLHWASHPVSAIRAAEMH
jgi:cytochrome c oxidase cbb3-type subunit 3